MQVLSSTSILRPRSSPKKSALSSPLPSKAPGADSWDSAFSLPNFLLRFYCFH